MEAACIKKSSQYLWDFLLNLLGIAQKSPISLVSVGAVI